MQIQIFENITGNSGITIENSASQKLLQSIINILTHLKIIQYIIYIIKYISNITLRNSLKHRIRSCKEINTMIKKNH